MFGAGTDPISLVGCLLFSLQVIELSLNLLLQKRETFPVIPTSFSRSEVEGVKAPRHSPPPQPNSSLFAPYLRRPAIPSSYLGGSATVTTFPRPNSTSFVSASATAPSRRIGPHAIYMPPPADSKPLPVGSSQRREIWQQPEWNGNRFVAAINAHSDSASSSNSTASGSGIVKPNHHIYRCPPDLVDNGREERSRAGVRKFISEDDQGSTASNSRPLKLRIIAPVPPKMMNVGSRHAAQRLGQVTGDAWVKEEQFDEDEEEEELRYSEGDDYVAKPRRYRKKKQKAPISRSRSVGRDSPALSSTSSSSSKRQRDANDSPTTATTVTAAQRNAAQRRRAPDSTGKFVWFVNHSVP
jgi:hypothetical protein